jgi:DNA-binding transcriptional LysR family regulator
LDLLVCPPLDVRHKAIASEPLLETGIVVIVSAGHPMLAETPSNISGLFKYPIAIPFLETRYLRILRDNYGIDLNAQIGRVLCSDLEMLVRVVANSSRLFTAGPCFAFADEIAAGQLHVVDLDVPFKHIIQLHTNRDAYPLPAVTQVTDIIRQALTEFRATEAAR